MRNLRAWRALVPAIFIVFLATSGAAFAQSASCPSVTMPGWFERPTADELRTMSKKVFIHYVHGYPLWINSHTTGDYYEDTDLQANKWSLLPDDCEADGDITDCWGPTLRDRPLPADYVTRPTGEWDTSFLAPNYRAEVCLAAALGADGFVFDLEEHPDSYDRAAKLMSAVADVRTVVPNFGVVIAPAMTSPWSDHQFTCTETNTPQPACPGDTPSPTACASPKLVDWVSTLSRSKGAYRLNDIKLLAAVDNQLLVDGQLVMAPFSAQKRSPAWWKDFKKQMRVKQVDVALVPVFQTWSTQDRCLKEAYDPVSYGFSDWGSAGYDVSNLEVWRWAPVIAHQRGSFEQRIGAEPKIWMAPVRSQQTMMRAGWYWEAAGSLNWRENWENAIQAEARLPNQVGQVPADWIQIATWNDYGEATQMAPSAQLKSSLYDLSAFYTAWFKTGQRPKINENVVFYFHRAQTTAGVAAGADFVNYDAVTPPHGGYDKNDVEALAFLKEPCTVEIWVNGSKVKTQNLAPDSTRPGDEVNRGYIRSVTAPLTPGSVPPSIHLTCGGVTTILNSDVTVSDAGITYDDMTYRSDSSWRRAHPWP